MVDRWNYCLLSSVCEEITSGGAAPQGDKYFINGKYPFVRVVDMGNLHGQKYMLQTRDLLNDVGAEKLRLFPSGTILFTKSGASLLLNQRAILKVPMYVVSHIGCLIPNEAIISEWLYYWMKTVDFNIYAHATTLPSLKLTTIKELRIPVPTIPEQERIVARIEELFSQLDAGVETLKKTKAQLAVYRQAVLKEAFEGRLTASGPEKIVRLGDYIETPRYGTSKKCSYDDGRDRTAVYRIPNIEHKNGRISHDDIKYAQFTESELDGIRLQQGDILIIRSNGSVSLVGRAAMVCDADITGTFAGYLMRLRISEPETLLPKFLLLFLQSHQARIYIENKAKSTSGVHNINSTEISDLQMPLYDPDTQYAIIEAIESRLSVCDSIEQTVDTALQQAEAMRQGILKQAFGGAL